MVRRSAIGATRTRDAPLAASRRTPPRRGAGGDSSHSWTRRHSRRARPVDAPSWGPPPRRERSRRRVDAAAIDGAHRRAPRTFAASTRRISGTRTRRTRTTRRRSRSMRRTSRYRATTGGRARTYELRCGDDDDEIDESSTIATAVFFAGPDADAAGSGRRVHDTARRPPTRSRGELSSLYDGRSRLIF